MLRQTLPLFLVLAPIAVRAQEPTPVLIQSGAAIQIPVPAGADKPRLQVLIAGSNIVLDDERANIQNSVATARLEADPGIYDVRVVANDKTRTPLGPARSFQIPGFKRETGRWLFNGSPVVYEGTNPPAVFSTPPVLRRDQKAKLPLSVATNGDLKWDVKSFGTEFRPDIRLAAGDGAVSPTSLTTAKDDFQKERGRRDASLPNGALILSLAAEGAEVHPWQGAYIEAIAPLVDGILIDCGTTPSPNPLLKVARRNVEETPNFDLPVFARFSGVPTGVQTLRAFQDGAANIIVPEGASNPVLDVLARQSARFSGAVTLEDAGLRADDLDRFGPYLRRAGRIPLLARLPGEGNGENKDNGKNAESMIVAFNPSTTSAVLDKVEKAAKIGATIYCEGALPPALLPRWGEITKTQLTALATPRKGTVTLADPWFWGTINDQNFDVSQTVGITVKPSVTSQMKEQKGLARETIARPLARYNDDPNAIMLCPVDKGRIIWAPFDVSRTPSLGRARTKVSMGLIYDNDLEPLNELSGPLQTSYYAAIAGAMQASLAEYTATKGDVSNVSVALRAIPADPKDPKSSAISLIAFFNSSSQPVEISTEVRGDGDYALDLITNKTVPVKVRDFGVRMALDIPANGFRWIALSQDQQAWDKAGKNGVKAQLR